MKRRMLDTISLSSVMLAIVLGAAGPAQAQNASAPYRTMAPLGLHGQTPRVVAHGLVRIDTFYAPSLGVEKHIVIYLPPAYLHDPKGRFPVAYYLHGLHGSETDWVGLGEIDRVADSLTAGGMRPMILAMPDGDDGWYTNWVEQGSLTACEADTASDQVSATYCVARRQYEDYVVHDVIAYVDSTYRTSADAAHRGVAGLSMGGYGAIELALGFPRLFAAAASHSGAVSLLYAGPHPFVAPPAYETSNGVLRTKRFTPAFGYDTVSWDSRDPAHLARRLRTSGTRFPALFLDVGTEDQLTRDQNRAFDWELNQLGVPHHYAEWPGRHDWSYWHAHVGEGLQWLAGQIAR
jgi:putative tributyrin esterase